MSHRYLLNQDDIRTLLQSLRSDGYRIISYVLENDALLLGELPEGDLPPLGLKETQAPASFKLEQTSGKTFFSNTVGHQTWRRYLNPPSETLFESSLVNGKLKIERNEAPPPKLAFWGVRGCDLKAIGISDSIFINDRFVDPYYKARRDNIFVIAADCPQPASTCFCTSFDSGPEVSHDSSYDIALTEIEPGILLARTPDKSTHSYLNTFKKASEENIHSASDVMKSAREKITRSFDSARSKDILTSNLNHSHWDDIAQRCLACSNCTMVCPTCFCTTIDESPSLDSPNSNRIRRWDSCYNVSHSYIHGGHIRSSIKSRYRQWLTHKLANWETQFNTSGCTGCGRCVTWCPASIDFIKEIPLLELQEEEIVN